MKTAEDVLRGKGCEIISVPPDATVSDAVKLMVGNKVGAVLVKEGETYIGIWTERDLMRNTTLSDFNPSTAVISEYMETGLKSCDATETVYQLMDKFLGLRLRHLLVEREGEYIGLLSIGDVIKASLRLRTAELEQLNEAVNWEYYADWKQSGEVPGR